jgi:peptide/nickel transport system substrate-binding protein
LATLLSDSIHGNFQLTFLRWVGANNDPDVFEFVFSSKRFPPDGANRGHYRNPRVDALTDQIRAEMDQEKRKALCSEVQKILADDLPYIPMWFTDVISPLHKSPGFRLSNRASLNLAPCSLSVLSHCSASSISLTLITPTRKIFHLS